MKNLKLNPAAVTMVAIFLTVFAITGIANAQSAAASAYPPGPSGQAPSVGPTSVVVTNSNLQPVPVYGAVVNTPQGTPVQIKLYAAFGYDSVAPKATYTIPAGKRLVIEHIATHCTTNIGIAVARTFIVRMGAGQDTSLTWLNVNAVPYLVQNAFYTIGTAEAPVQANLDGGDLWVDGISSTSNAGQASCEFAILGYLVNAPQQAN